MVEREPASLDARIRDEIERHGPIEFARFMERALTEPEIGYYAGESVRAGRGGDFLTAPELHPLLGSALARLATAAWERLDRPAPFRWIEYGAGAGALVAAAIDQLERDKTPLRAALEVAAVEVNPHRRTELAARLAARGVPLVSGPVAHATPPAAAGIVVANEYLDALPFHIVVGRPASPLGFAERRVGVDAATGALAWVEVPPDPRLAPLFAARLAQGAPLVEGQLAEICLAADAWAAGLPGVVSRGLVAVLDYGHPAPLLRAAATRMAGTALAYQGHRATGDLLGEPGGRDLTAHVDLTALRTAAQGAGLTPVAATTQAALLAGVGLDDELDRLRRGPEATLEGALALRAALAHLMDPRRMGGFAVELFAIGSATDRERLADPAAPLPGAAAPNRRLV